MREFPFVNTTGSTIPAGAALRVTGTNAAGFTTVGQANADSSMYVVFNAPVDVADGGYGVAFGWDGGVVPVAVNPADEPYTASDTFGTANGDWKLRKGKKGFRLPTASVQGIANAVPDPAANFGWTPVTKNLQTNTCPVFSIYGAITGIRVEYTPVTWGPTGVTFGTPYCVTNPTGCCPVAITCEGCPEPITLPANACLVLVERTGVAADAGFGPTVIPLEVTTNLGLFSYVPRDRVTSGPYTGVFTYTTGGGGSAWAYLNVAVACSGTGDPITLRYNGTWVGAGNSVGPLSPANDVGGLPTGALDSPLIAFSGELVHVPCTAFDATSGAILLGTVSGYCNGTGGPATSLDAYLSWGVECETAVDPPDEGCPPNCSLTATFFFDDGTGGGGGSGSFGFTLPLSDYDSATNTVYWETTATTRCGTNILWVVVCDGSGALSLLGYDGDDLVFSATFAPTGGTTGSWTGTIALACGDITEVTLATSCSELRDGTPTSGVTPPPPP